MLRSASPAARSCRHSPREATFQIYDGQRDRVSRRRHASNGLSSPVPHEGPVLQAATASRNGSGQPNGASMPTFVIRDP
jgi:hypothetical protein